jgi:hypothetical protein
VQVVNDPYICIVASPAETQKTKAIKSSIKLIMGQDEDNLQAASLPGDVLVMANILGRLPSRWLAVSRSVCKAWQAIIDARCLLRIDLLPLRIEGIFTTGKIEWADGHDICRRLFIGAGTEPHFIRIP